MKNSLKLAGLAAVGMIAAGTATADTIVGTFHAATTDNTFVVGDEGADIVADTNWFVAVGTVGGEPGFNHNLTPVPLVTRISGLNPGDLYEVGIVYSNLSFFENTNIAGGLTLDNLIDVPAINPDPLTDLLNTDFGTAYDLALGIGTVDANGDISVFVDDAAGSNFSGFFLAYNGVTLQQVPEPSSLALLGLGGLALIRRRR